MVQATLRTYGKGEAMRVNDLIFDVGLHKGEDTEFYLKKGFRVVAFEANPELVAFCTDRFARDIDAGRLTIEAGAVVNDPSVANVKFYTNPDKSVWGTVAEDWVDRNAHLGTSSAVIEVPAVDFAAALRRHGVPYYMKIDIEGMDRVCLQSLKHVQDRPAYVSIESEKVDRSQLVEEIALMEELGYHDFQAVQQFGIQKRREPDPAREGVLAHHSFAEGASGLFGRDLPDHWVSRDALLDEYDGIFERYRKMGDESWLRRNAVTRVALKALERLTGTPLPGWYDTHARHESVSV